ncbi:MAG TPA: hypothetical protein VKM94_21365, partial [Blastocatellia bacterium]|nr:hypothetical protein [Blastocatellia bacterium]
MKDKPQKNSGELQASDYAREREAEGEPRSHPFHALQRSAGNQAVARMLREKVLQAKLRVSQPTDASEIEADRVA